MVHMKLHINGMFHNLIQINDVVIMKKAGRPPRKLGREAPLKRTLKTIHDEKKERKKRKSSRIDYDEINHHHSHSRRWSKLFRVVYG